MANAVIMPKAGITVESCIIGEWVKKVGDQVKIGDVLFTYETDKASFECGEDAHAFVASQARWSHSGGPTIRAFILSPHRLMKSP